MGINWELEEVQREAGRVLKERVWSDQGLFDKKHDKLTVTPKTLEEIVFDVLEQLAERNYL